MNVGIQCAMCGKTSDFDAFCFSPMGLPLPKFHYQCPSCNHAFQLVKTSQPTINQNGQILPPELAVVGSQASL